MDIATWREANRLSSVIYALEQAIETTLQDTTGATTIMAYEASNGETVRVSPGSGAQCNQLILNDLRGQLRVAQTAFNLLKI